MSTGWDGTCGQCGKYVSLTELAAHVKREHSRLRPIVKDMATTLRASNGQPLRRECWSAVTTDGLWAFDRIEDVGTPWIVTYKPRTPEAQQVLAFAGALIPAWFGTLKAARAAVERGGLALSAPA